ncbi:MAG: hypothetical protein ACRDF4_08515, partial [Rhabdochlamydiaceae bacterium]
MQIKHFRGSYSVEFVSPDALFAGLEPEKLRVITDENVVKAVTIPPHIQTLVLPAGEQSKQFGTYRRVVSWLTETRTSRSHKVVALGGGVIGDLAGFAAATYMSGINLVMVPTSLFAMVDSS